MTHVSIDGQTESVKQFVLGQSVDPGGLVLEMNGHAVACVMPPPKSPGNDVSSEWSDAKNARRITLIKLKHAEGISPAEHVELAGLQEEMLRYRQKVAPLPLDEARRIHQELSPNRKF